MKTSLTKEQSQHLIDLGVPKEKASLVSVKEIYDWQGNAVKNPKKFIRKSPFRPAVMGFETFQEYPIFSIEDFLNGEILPKELYSNSYLDEVGNEAVPKSYGNYEFIIRRWYGQWAVFYKNGEGGFLCQKIFESEELIDALYQLACWYYGKYLKSEKK